MDLLEVYNLKKSFGKINPIQVVDGVTLNLKKGEIFGYLGPNGAGKTTTLRVLATLLKPDSGDIYISGIPYLEGPKKIRTQIGYVSQKGSSDQLATLLENLILQGRIYGMSKNAAFQKAKEFIKKFSLQHCEGRKVKTFSGGEKRRLDIALGLLHSPKILFLDEPTLGLDPQGRIDLWKMIKQIQEEGTTIFLTSHYLEEIDLLADRLAIINQGKIIAQGSPSELKNNVSKEIVNVYFHGKVDSLVLDEMKKIPLFQDICLSNQKMKIFTQKGSLAIVDILRFLESKKISVEKAEFSVPTLNDVFLKQTGQQIEENVLNTIGK